MHTFTISANISHAGPTPRWNTEYGRWVAEHQQEQLVAAKNAIINFPASPLRATHRLSQSKHLDAAWSLLPTPVPTVVAVAGATDNDDDDDDDDDEVSDGEDSDGDDDGVGGGGDGGGVASCS